MQSYALIIRVKYFKILLYKMKRLFISGLYFILCILTSSVTTGLEDDNILPQSYGIFHSLQSVLETLKDVHELFLIPEVKKVYDNQFKTVPSVLPRVGRKAFIVIEGVKGIGKSATSRIFAKMINGTYLRSPLPSLIDIRSSLITQQPRLIRSAFHALNNYVIAEHIKELTKTTAVIMDQYWHGLTAFALAKLAGIPHHLPDKNSNIYCFPGDLLQPDVTYLITVRDEKRLFRLPDTGRPAVSKVFSDTIHKAYLLMREPNLISINGDRSRNDVETDLIHSTLELCSDLL
uniref:Thymidylate kinase-like domain-containing protein n=2 Tax=Clastoptera arizonana TaxID=38151 RepID=A0A1B6E432_9HEMI